MSTKTKNTKTKSTKTKSSKDKEYNDKDTSGPTANFRETFQLRTWNVFDVVNIEVRSWSNIEL